MSTSKKSNPNEALKHHVSGAVERGEAEAIREESPQFRGNVARAKELMRELPGEANGEELLGALDRCEIGNEEMEQAELELEKGVSG